MTIPFLCRTELFCKKNLSPVISFFLSIVWETIFTPCLSTIIPVKKSKRTKAHDMQKSSDCVEILKDLIEKLGYERKELKTLYFNIDTEYESYQARDKSWKRRFKGYKYVHRMKLEFPAAYRIDEENKMRDFWDRTAEA